MILNLIFIIYEFDLLVIEKTLDKLNPKRISPLLHLPVVSVINALSFIPAELEK